jgi:uncharacterized repeat protein (TIGR03833 family)
VALTTAASTACGAQAILLTPCDEQAKAMSGNNRKAITPGMKVAIVLKQDQRSDRRTRGIVKDILTKSATHPHGIKVRLETGEVGRVKEIIDEG